MSDPSRKAITAAAQTIVVKVGTRVLTSENGTLNRQRIAKLAEEIHKVMQTGRKVVLVSSGAVAAGVNRLGLTQRPHDLARLQAVAAVGQSALIEAYESTFSKHQRHAAQVLLTADGLNDRKRYLNVCNTLTTLMEYGAVPIINENDTVAVDELMTTFGDNDRLAALVTNLIRAQLLVILSDVDGLYDGNPDDPNTNPIDVVRQFDEKVFSYVRDSKSTLGKGGMLTKLEAAQIVTQAGEHVIIASGHQPGTLHDILAGKSVGTLLVAQGKMINSKKRWIGFSAQPTGRLLLDAGAKRAIEEQGRSLLAIGIVASEGQFNKGDVVSLCHPDNHEFARGLSNYESADLHQILGLRTDQIRETLGHCPYDEVVHRDNMTLLGVFR